MRFPCDGANQLDYDFQNGGASPRNAAFFWTTESLKYLKIVSDLDLKTDVSRVSRHHHMHPRIDSKIL